MLLSFLFDLFLVGILAQCAYLFLFFRLFKNRNDKNIQSPVALQPVSVIICARNESESLKSNLPLVLEQAYAGEQGRSLFEVIVVNDASEDETAEVLSALSVRYPSLHIVTITSEMPRTLPGKKFALSKGMEQAKYEWLLLTDADCRPASPDWIKLMTAPLQQQGKEIVAGYGGYLQKPGLLNAFIRWETMHTFLQYGSYLLAGRPYMAVGRNLACRKSRLLQAQANKLWQVLPSGDDDLLMRICATAHNTALVSAPEAFTCSPAKRTWKEWVRQKQRHLSTGKLYKPEIKMLLGFYGISHALTWLLFIALCCTGQLFPALIFMAVRCILYWIVWQRTARLLQEKTLWLFFPLFDIGWFLYNCLFSPYILWKNKQKWS